MFDWSKFGITKWYYADDSVCIINKDNREVLPQISQIDLILADPPYGVDYQSNHRTDKFDKIYGDKDYPFDWLEIITKKINKGSVYLFCNEASLDDGKLLLFKNKWSSNRLLIWDKQSTSGGDLNNYGLRTEFILYGTKQFSPDKPKLNGSRDGNLISIPRIRPQDLQHPNEKPYLLMAYFVMKSTNPSEVVLDPFMGSGYSAKATKDLGRKFIGIEINEKFCEIAAKRVQQSVMDFNFKDRVESTKEKQIALI